MKIVVLDGYTLNPGDLSWIELESLGETIVYDRTSPEHTIEHAKDADIVLTNKTILFAEIINSLTNLKYIGVLATGYNIVDMAAAKNNGIIVTNVPAYSTRSVAQLVFSLILELSFNVGLHSRSVKDLDWCTNPDFSYWKSPLIELNALTLGIVGFGQIGREVAKIGNSFGMKILVSNRSEIQGQAEYIFAVTFEQLLKSSDFISLNLPLNKESENLIAANELTMMKKNSYLINTSRGPIVNEQDLADALNNDQIAGAGLDVLSTEPPDKGNPLLHAKNCIITPHIGWATQASRKRLMQIAVENIRSFLNNNYQNVVE